MAHRGALEIVFSFDTTGSMYGFLEQVRGRIQDMIQRLQSDIPGIRFAVFAHGDYCDTKRYVTKWIDFTTDVAALCDFVQTVERTGGGDPAECYELVLRQVRTELSWTPGSRRVLVLIGDNEPHDVDYYLNKDKIDWREELKELVVLGVTIYGVQPNDCGFFENFYKTISLSTGGKHLQLSGFASLFDVLMAVCYREGPDTAMLASYEKEVRARCGRVKIGGNMDSMFSSPRGNADAASEAASSRSDDCSMDVDDKELKLKKPKMSKKASFAVKSRLLAKAEGPRRQRVRSMYGRLRASAPKNIKSLRAFRQENLPLLKRENVPEKNFSLRTLKWSSWQMTMSPEKPEDGDGMTWIKRRGQEGYRARMIKSEGRIRNDQRQALFEVAVQTPGSGKLRHVVHSSFSTRCVNNALWESCLRGVRGQLEHVLRNGCHVYLRHCIIGKRQDPSCVRGDLKRYDYAWKTLRQRRGHTREVFKGAYCISTN